MQKVIHLCDGELQKWTEAGAVTMPTEKTKQTKQEAEQDTNQNKQKQNEQKRARWSAAYWGGPFLRVYFILRFEDQKRAPSLSYCFASISIGLRPSRPEACLEACRESVLF